jgi:hypothetical protein
MLWIPSAASVAAQAPEASWAGTWTGTLVNLPERPGSAPVDVTMEIGEWPAAGACTVWRTTYSEHGTVRQVKDYRLCRGEGEDGHYIDEGDGVKLAARWIGDVLVSPFKVGSTLLVMTVRLRGDILEEEILTVADTPANSGIVSLDARAIQRLVFRRAAKAGGPSRDNHEAAR